MADSEKAKAIEAAFRRTGIAVECEEVLPHAVNAVMQVPMDGPGKAPPNFTHIGATQTRTELRRLAKLGSDVEALVPGLRAPALEVLGAYGYVRGAPPERARQAAKAVLKDQLEIESPVGGRPKDVRAHAIGTMLAYYYQELTGKRPTLRRDGMKDGHNLYGPYVELVAEIFRILRLNASIEDVAITAFRTHMQFGPRLFDKQTRVNSIRVPASSLARSFVGSFNWSSYESIAWANVPQRAASRRKRRPKATQGKISKRASARSASKGEG